MIPNEMVPRRQCASGNPSQSVLDLLLSSVASNALISISSFSSLFFHSSSSMMHRHHHHHQSH